MPEIKYDPEGAKALLAEAGYPDGFTMEIAADMSASDTMTMALEIIKEQLAQVGINAEIKNYDESTWLETRKSGELGSFISTWTADYNDPDNFIYTFFGNAEKTTARSLNYPDTAVMECVAAARTILDNDERMKEYGFPCFPDSTSLLFPSACRTLRLPGTASATMISIRCPSQSK